MDGEQIAISNQTIIPDDSGHLWVGKQGRLEVTRDSLNGMWYAHIPIEVETPPCRTSSKWASLDLGIYSLAALYTEGERAAIYSGRAVLSDWVYRTKKIADRQSKLPKRKHSSWKINAAYRKRTRRLRHSVNAMLRGHLREARSERCRSSRSRRSQWNSGGREPRRQRRPEAP